MQLLARFHLVAVVVADEVQDGVNERRAPLRPDDLRADDDVAELARQPVGQLVERIERKRERVGRLVDAEVLALQRLALLRADEREPELARVDAFGSEDAADQLDRAGLVDLHARPVLDLDLDHRRRSVPVSSEWRLYASTIRCTSLCRTTSWWLKWTNAMPSID